MRDTVHTGEETRCYLMKLVAWSLTALCDGKWPTHDVNGVAFDTNSDAPAHWIEKAGSDLCGPFRACLDGLQGDQDYLAKLLKLKRSWDYEFRGL